MFCFQLLDANKQWKSFYDKLYYQHQENIQKVRTESLTIASQSEQKYKEAESLLREIQEELKEEQVHTPPVTHVRLEYLFQDSHQNLLPLFSHKIHPSIKS